MDCLLEDSWGHSASYIDDIAVYSKTWSEHLCYLQEVFTCIRSAGLTVKLKKCQFGMEECSFLGHVVGHGKVKPEDGKIQAVKDFKIPATKKDVRAFLGLVHVGYYMKFIPHFVEMSDLTKHNLPNKVDWKPHHQLAFDTLRNCLQDKPVFAQITASSLYSRLMRQREEWPPCSANLRWMKQTNLSHFIQESSFRERLGIQPPRRNAWLSLMPLNTSQCIF